MKKVIPEVVEYYCDRCGKLQQPSEIDCKGNAHFVGRDYSGHAVGGTDRSFEFCSSCSTAFDKFLSGEQ